jgi:hypothetical protein
VSAECGYLFQGDEGAELAPTYLHTSTKCVGTIVHKRSCYDIASQGWIAEMKESFWGDLYGQTKLAWQRFFELESQRERDRFSGCGRYERRPGKKPRYRNGYYWIITHRQ